MGRKGANAAWMQRCARDQLLVQRACIMHVLPGDRREERRAEAPHVGARVDLVAAALRLLGRHELRRTDGHAGAGGLGAAVHAVTAEALHASEPEVEQLHAPVVAEEDVVRLHVAMDDALVVRGAERVEGLVGDLEDLVDGQRAAEANPSRLDVLSLEEIEHQEGAAVLGDTVVLDVHDAVVTHGVRDVAFAKEPCARALVTRELRVQHLDRDLVAVAMRRGVDRGHAARADAGVDVPLAVDHGTDARRQCRTRASTRGTRRLAHGFPPPAKSFASRSLADRERRLAREARGRSSNTQGP